MIQTSLLQSTHADLVTDAAYDFYGLRLATCSLDQRIKIWTLDETTGTWNNDSDWKAHDAPVCRLSWAHPEFGTILASCSFDKTVKIWEEGGVASHGGGGDGNTGSKWHERAVLSESRVTGASVRAVEFAPRHFGLRLAVLSSDSYLRIYDCVELHNLATWTSVIELDVQMMYTAPTPPPLSSSDMYGAPGTSVGSSNGQSYGSGVGNTRPGKREADGGWSLSWCKERTWGQLLAVAAGTTGVVKVLYFTDSRSHKTAFTLPHSTIGLTDSGVAPAVTTVAWAPTCGRRYHLIATGGRDGKVKIWKVTPPQGADVLGDGEWIVNQAGTFDEHQFAVNRVEWNVTGTVLSSAGNDGNIRLWKATYAGAWRSMGYIHTDHGDEEGAEDMQD
ncbi:hypothetical protein M408DRAFT_331986 [Serendipita vermifera MAFF 305830]|uniref:Anaphase-promoting complex subunit 4 WD40 domain-containing protein n=1 Tax=Serendipita vermifera MAFF 305830 TaxID=933852 RepID=A0A0C3AVP3_SERVB|nr:hypothetical protein M408DRAFT_331986 [Serendipita vermifera MAFF 305830]